MKTKVTELLGIEHPIISAPLGPDISGPELVAAVSNAGGFGILQAQLAPPPLFREEIHAIRALTDKPFGVNLLLNFPIEDQVKVCLEEEVPALSFFWGDISPYVDLVHQAGIKVIHQVGSVAAAERSAKAGADLIIAQGVEAGGHVEGTVSTMVLVPQAVAAVAPTPVAAAGGIANAQGAVAALAMGAEAAVLGTRFLASDESRAHPEYKQRLLTAKGENTVRTPLFGFGWPHAPHRALRTPFVEEWLSEVDRGQESRADEPVIGKSTIAGVEMPIQQFMGFPPNASSTGDIELRCLLAGQNVGMIDDIRPAGEIVAELAADIDELSR